MQNQIAGKQNDKGKGRTCYTCGRTGHLARDCWNAKGERWLRYTQPSTQCGKKEMGTQEFQAPLMQRHTKTRNNFPLQFHKMFVKCNNRSCSYMLSADLQFDSLNLEVRAVFFDMSQDDFLEGVYATRRFAKP